MNRTAIVAASVWVCLPILAAGQQPADSAKTGLKIGTVAPAVKLKDQTGTERTLDQLRQGADYLALVFYRSAGW